MSSRRPAILLGIVLLLLTFAACLLFAAKPLWFPAAITTEAVAWDRQFTSTLWIAAILFIAAHLLLALPVIRARQRPTVSNANYRRLELTWTLATAALFIALSVFGSRGWAKIPTRGVADSGRETIEVHAHQFAWNFRYPGPDARFGRTALEFINDAGGNPLGIDPDFIRNPAGKDDIVTATLRIPAHRGVLLLLHSRDVIHDFFVPELRTKQDIVPGMEIPLELRVDRTGTYEIACAELCGLGHSQMRALLIVMAPEEYDSWKRKQR